MIYILKHRKSIYLITDNSIFSFEELVTKVEEALRGGIDYLQYRNKSNEGKQMYGEACILKNICRKYNVPLIINDRIDIALATGADGVHLGNNDIPVTQARRIMPSNKIVGATAKTLEQAIKAQSCGADYLGVGDLFGSKTKPNAKQISISILKIIKEYVSIPVYGIGGISIDKIDKDVLKYVNGFCISRAILASNDPYGYVKELKKKFLKIEIDIDIYDNN